jgi:hypothetical protein
MANNNYLQLPSVAAAALTDVTSAVQSNVTVQETWQQVFNLFLANTVLNFAGNPNGNVAGNIYQLCYDTTDAVLYVCTTSGSVSTAIWKAVSPGSFPISLANGGTSASLTAIAGGIVYSSSSALAINSPGSSGTVLQSNGTSAPTFSTASYPISTTINQILFSSATNTITGLTTANSGSLVTSSTGVPNWLGPLTNGQVVIGWTGAQPVAATLTAGANISITNGTGTIAIAATGSASFAWNDVTTASSVMSPNNGYIVDKNTGPVVLTLPSVAAQGTVIEVAGGTSGSATCWQIAQNAGQAIHYGSATTTVGATGYLQATLQYDTVKLLCVVANTIFVVLSSIGNLTVN